MDSFINNAYANSVEYGIDLPFVHHNKVISSSGSFTNYHDISNYSLNVADGGTREIKKEFVEKISGFGINSCDKAKFRAFHGKHLGNHDRVEVIKYCNKLNLIKYFNCENVVLTFDDNWNDAKFSFDYGTKIIKLVYNKFTELVSETILDYSLNTLLITVWNVDTKKMIFFRNSTFNEDLEEVFIDDNYYDKDNFVIKSQHFVHGQVIEVNYC